ncbi:MAG: tyrosine--tRNA ligase, partial [Gemmatimonadales bacterium]|nr:tyrosine--tRNA ligase [Gemmatimonadales bacterium]
MEGHASHRCVHPRQATPPPSPPQIRTASTRARRTFLRVPAVPFLAPRDRRAVRRRRIIPVPPLRSPGRSLFPPDLAPRAGPPTARFCRHAAPGGSDPATGRYRIYRHQAQMFLPVDEQIRRIREGAESIVPEDELVVKLERSAREDRPLLIKQGFDPTRPDLHIGHGVSIHKLRTFQELGHRVVFVMGDFTARVGDPSGRDETRPMLSEEEIESNLATYEDQVFRILDPAATEIRKNSEWLAGLALADILRLTSQYTVARML